MQLLPAIDHVKVHSSHSTWVVVFRRFVRHRLAVVSTFVLSFMIMSVLLVPVFMQRDPNTTDAANRLQAPSFQHVMGTDDMGRDLGVRLLYGGRSSLVVGFLAASVSLLLGLLIGGVAGYYGGLLDSALMHITDLFLSLPSLFVVLVLNLLLRETRMSYMRTGTVPVAVVIGMFSWMELARIVRALFLSLHQEEYVVAARAIGSSRLGIVCRHMLLNSLGPVIVNYTLLVSGAILSESGLSYLGFGVQPPTPTWGNLLNRAQNYFFVAPWLAVYPGLMICLTVVTVNSIGDGLRDALDPYFYA